MADANKKRKQALWPDLSTYGIALWGDKSGKIWRVTPIVPGDRLDDSVIQKLTEAGFQVSEDNVWVSHRHPGSLVKWFPDVVMRPTATCCIQPWWHKRPDEALLQAQWLWPKPVSGYCLPPGFVTVSLTASDKATEPLTRDAIARMGGVRPVLTQGNILVVAESKMDPAMVAAAKIAFSPPKPEPKRQKNAQSQDRRTDAGRKIGGAAKDRYALFSETLEIAASEALKMADQSIEQDVLINWLRTKLDPIRRDKFLKVDVAKLRENGLDACTAAVVLAAQKLVATSAWQVAKVRLDLDSYSVINIDKALEIGQDYLDAITEIGRRMEQIADPQDRLAYMDLRRFVDGDPYGGDIESEPLAALLTCTYDTFRLPKGSLKLDPVAVTQYFANAATSLEEHINVNRMILDGVVSHIMHGFIYRGYDVIPTFSKGGEHLAVTVGLWRNALEQTGRLETFEKMLWEAMENQKGRGSIHRLVDDDTYQMPDAIRNVLHREGPIRRKGDITEAQVMADFGLDAIEYGNSVLKNQKLAQRLLNAAYDALADFADVWGIDPKQIGGGVLGLALGSRGKGKMLGHYEPDRRVINLVCNSQSGNRLKGAGALAHEIFHALDHRLGLRNGIVLTVEQFASYRDTPLREFVGACRYRDRLANLSESDDVPDSDETMILRLQRCVSRFPLFHGNGYVKSLKQRIEEILETDDDDGLVRVVSQMTDGRIQKLSEAKSLRQALERIDGETAEDKAAHCINLFKKEITPLLIGDEKDPLGRIWDYIERSAEVTYKRGRTKYLYYSSKGGQWFDERMKEAGVDEQTRLLFLLNFYSSGNKGDYLLYRKAHQVYHDLKSDKWEMALSQHQGVTSFYHSAKTLDAHKGGKPYYVTRHEMLAHALAAVTHRLLEEKDIRNDFLTASCAPGKYNDPEKYVASPVPEGKEIDLLVEAAKKHVMPYLQSCLPMPVQETEEVQQDDEMSIGLSP